PISQSTLLLRRETSPKQVPFQATCHPFRALRVPRVPRDVLWHVSYHVPCRVPCLHVFCLGVPLGGPRGPRGPLVLLFSFRRPSLLLSRQLCPRISSRICPFCPFYPRDL